jgi:amino acid adenylation domain-containing protein
LNRRANQLAHYLQTLGLGPEQRVGICLERNPEMIIALLAVLKAGGAYVPLDPAYPQDRLAFIIQDAGVSIVLSQSQWTPRLAGFDLIQVCLDIDWKLIGQHSGENPTGTVTSDQLAYLIYTSGSTGRPKGVMIQHRALVNFTTAADLEYAIGPGDRVLQFASINFDASAEEIYPCLTRGATLVLRPEAMLESSAIFWQYCRAWQLTVLDLPTAYWHELTLDLAAESLTLPEKLRLVIIGGERALPERLRLWQTYTGRRVRLVNTYGPTEATVVATMADLTNLEPEKMEMAELPIGRPLANVQLYVLDQALQPVPAGVPGELHIGGAGLAKGYLNRPELTQEKFIPNPFKGNDESDNSSFIIHHSSFLYKTGDLVRYRRDGQLEFWGRVDDQVKIRGFRIELGEIEAVLSQHPAVQEVAVLAREDKAGDKRLVAYLVPQAEAAPAAADLRHFLGEKLPSYMVPAAFVILAALPLTPNGKIDRQALPAPDDIDQAQQDTFVAPRTELEAQLAQVWEDVLGVRPIGIKDSFFDLGGHSLLAIRLLTQIARTIGKKLHLATLFQGPTIEEQARIMQEGSTSLLLPVQSSGSKLPFFCVPGGGDNAFIFTDLARYLGSEQPLYSFRFPEWDFDQPAEDRVKEMAAKYIEEMKTLQPEGPYLLGGYCFGGVVAFEMAQQLQAQGQQVGLVAIFESYRPGASHLPGFMPRVRHHFDRFRQLPAQEKWDYLLKRANQRFLKIGPMLMTNLER